MSSDNSTTTTTSKKVGEDELKRSPIRAQFENNQEDTELNSEVEYYVVERRRVGNVDVEIAVGGAEDDRAANNNDKSIVSEIILPSSIGGAGLSSFSLNHTIVDGGGDKVDNLVRVIRDASGGRNNDPEKQKLLSEEIAREIGLMIADDQRQITQRDNENLSTVVKDILRLSELNDTAEKSQAHEVLTQNLIKIVKESNGAGGSEKDETAKIDNLRHIIDSALDLKANKQVKTSGVDNLVEIIRSASTVNSTDSSSRGVDKSDVVKHLVRVMAIDSPAVSEDAANKLNQQLDSVAESILKLSEQEDKSKASESIINNLVSIVNEANKNDEAKKDSTLQNLRAVFEEALPTRRSEPSTTLTTRVEVLGGSPAAAVIERRDDGDLTIVIPRSVDIESLANNVTTREATASVEPVTVPVEPVTATREITLTVTETTQPSESNNKDSAESAVATTVSTAVSSATTEPETTAITRVVTVTANVEPAEKATTEPATVSTTISVAESTTATAVSATGPSTTATGSSATVEPEATTRVVTITANAEPVIDNAAGELLPSVITASGSSRDILVVTRDTDEAKSDSAATAASAEPSATTSSTTSPPPSTAEPDKSGAASSTTTTTTRDVTVSTVAPVSDSTVGPRSDDGLTATTNTTRETTSTNQEPETAAITRVVTMTTNVEPEKAPSGQTSDTAVSSDTTKTTTSLDSDQIAVMINDLFTQMVSADGDDAKINQAEASFASLVKKLNKSGQLDGEQEKIITDQIHRLIKSSDGSSSSSSSNSSDKLNEFESIATGLAMLLSDNDASGTRRVTIKVNSPSPSDKTATTTTDTDSNVGEALRVAAVASLLGNLTGSGENSSSTRSITEILNETDSLDARIMNKIAESQGLEPLMIPGGVSTSTESLNDIDKRIEAMAKRIDAESNNNNSNIRKSEQRDRFVSDYKLRGDQYDIVYQFFTKRKVNNRLSNKKLRVLMRECLKDRQMVKASGEDVDRALKSVDADKDDEITFTEFLNLLLLFFSSKDNLSRRIETALKIRRDDNEANNNKLLAASEAQQYVDYLNEFFGKTTTTTTLNSNKDQIELTELVNQLEPNLKDLAYVKWD